MAITSASTIAEIEAEILDNLDYERTASAAKAWAVVEATNAWLLKQPQAASSESHSLTLNAVQVAAIRDQAREVALHLDGNAKGLVRHFTMNEGFR